MSNRAKAMKNRKQGYTIFELLIVVGIIAVLLAMLLPAVQAAREAARRMSCSNNFKQIGLAFHNYHSAYNQLPQGCGGTGPTPGNDDLSNQRRLSALVPIIPFLEASPMWEMISNEYETADTPRPVTAGGGDFYEKGGSYFRDHLDELSNAPGPLINDKGRRCFPPMGPAPWRASVYPVWQLGMMTYRCPSDYTERPPKHAALSSYALCYGDGVQEVGEDVESISQRGVFANGRARAFRDIHDGLVNTLMMAEVLTDNGTRRATSAIAANIAGLRDDPSQCWATIDSRGAYLPNIQLRRTPDGLASRGGNWADGAILWSGFNTILPPNSPNCETSSNTAVNARLEGVFSASSSHQGGCHVLMADGAVKFVTTSIDYGDLQTTSVYPGSPTSETIDSPYGVWGALGTIGRESLEVEE